MQGITIKSNNFNGESVEITFNPYSGGTINLGTQTIPYDYLNPNPDGEYSIYIPAYDKTCPLVVGIPPTPSNTPTQTITPTPTITPTITTTPTLTPTPSITPSSSPPAAFDADAAAYLADVITSGGTTDATISAATNTLFTELKSNGLYSKMIAMYPYVGGTAASHAINATLNKSFDITWNGGMTHGISGTTGNGTNGYGNTNFKNTDFTSYDNYSFGFYQNTKIASVDSDEVSMGNYEPGQGFQISSNNQFTDWSFRSNSDTRTSLAHSGNIDGNYICNRTGTTYTSLSRNATTILSNTSTPDTTLASNNIYLFAIYAAGTAYPNTLSNQTFAFTFMGEGLSNTEITTLDGIINTFQTSLGRNTY